MTAHTIVQPRISAAAGLSNRASMACLLMNAYGWRDVCPECGFAVDGLHLDDDELADTLASAPDDIHERIESADYFFPDAAAAFRFQSHIKQSGKGKLPWRYPWPDEVRDDILARLLALNVTRAELERLTGLPSTGSGGSSPSASQDAPDSEPNAPAPPKPKRAKRASKRASKKSVPRPMFDEADE